MRQRFLLTEEGIREQPVGELLRKVFPLFRKHLRLTLLGFLLLIPVIIFELTPGLVLRHLFNDVFPAGDRSTFLLWCGFLVVAYISGPVFSYYQAVTLFRLGIEIVTDLKNRMFEHTLKLSLDFHESHSPGKLLSRVEADTETLLMLFGETAVQLIRNIITFGLILVILCYTDFGIASWLLILIPLMFGMVFGFLSAMRKLWMEIRARTAIIIGYVAEYVQGVEVIQQFNYQAVARRRMGEVNMNRYRVQVPVAIYASTFWGGFNFGEIVAIAVIVFIGYRGVSEGTLKIGTLVLFLEYVRRMFEPIMQLGEQLLFIQRALVSVERVFGILEQEVTVKDGTSPAEELVFEKEIVFENVWFSYEKDNWILKDVSFTIKKGETIALVGASGGGKTTIVNLILRFYDPQKGRITVDGRDIKDYPVDAWRNFIGLVLQDIYLFPGSVADNLRVFDESIDIERTREVARITRADRVIEKLPGGYDGELSERGLNLSVGERQLLSFARALACDPPLLVLDEATSSVDSHTERLVQESLEKLITGRTAVIVAHRLSTVLNSHRILLIEKGIIAEAGTHDELLALDGTYSKLFRLQFTHWSGVIPEMGGTI